MASASRQRIGRLLNKLRAKFPNVPRAPSNIGFSKVGQHPSAFLANVSRLVADIQDEDRARLLEPKGPKILRGWNPPPRPQTAIIAYAAQAAYERRMAQEKFEAAMASLSTRRRA